MDSAKRVISGTWGQVWVNGEIVAECRAAQAKYSHTKEDVNLCGVMSTDTKVTGTKGTGSLTLYKVRSRFYQYIENVMAGVDARATIISKLADPDAYGAERVVIENVSFDDATLFDWEAKKLGEITVPFTFTSHRFLDTIPSGS